MLGLLDLKEPIQIDIPSKSKVRQTVPRLESMNASLLSPRPVTPSKAHRASPRNVQALRDATLLTSFGRSVKLQRG
jgi:hypothetical protein